MDKGWVGEKVTCDLCSYSWIAVYNVSCERLECTNCGNMVYFESEPLNKN